MLIVAPRGCTKLEISLDTPRFSCAHLIEIGSVALLEQELKTLGAKAAFTFVPGGTHGNLDRIGDDAMGLEKRIAWEMYAVARPNSKLKPAPAK